MDEQPEYASEVGAFNRTYIRNEAINIRSPEGMFIYSLYDKIDKLALSENTKNALVQLARTIPDPGHKNAAAFVYGYMCVSSGGVVSKQAFDRVASRLEFGVTPPDVLRYARFISRIA